MKLSDVRGGRTLDVVADLIGPMANIASDPEAAAMFRREEVPEGKTAVEFFAERVRKSAPKLLRGHKDDVIAILSTIEGTDPEEYAEGLNLAKLLRDFVDLMTDEDFVAFLSPSGTETAEGAAGSA